MKFLSGKSNLLFATVLGAAAFGYVAFIFVPTQQSTAALEQELAAHRAYIAQQQSAVRTVANVQEELASTRQFAQQWRERAPSAERLGPVIGSLSACAARANVTTTQLNPSSAEPMALLARVPVTMVCEGDFSQIFELLRQLEAQPQSIWIEHIDITKPEKSTTKLRCELSLVVFADKRGNSH